MPRPLLLFVVGAALVLESTLAMALGFGSTRLQTTLGQRLDFAAILTLDADETVRRDCVTAEVQAGDAAVPPRSVHAMLQQTADPARPLVRVTTDTVIDEPVVTVEVTVGCGSKLTRRFVAFVDPPGLRLAQAEASETIYLPMQIDSQTASLADIARQADASRRGDRGGATSRAEPRPAVPRRAARPARAVVVASARSTATPRPRSASPVAGRRAPRFATTGSGGGARLQLDRPILLAARSVPSASAPPAAVPDLLVAATAASAAAVRTAVAEPTPPAAAGSDASGRDAAEAAQRLRALEADVARARGETQATQRTVAALQARLREAEGERFSNSFVYTLLATTLLAVLAAAALWWLRPRQRRNARWFEAQAKQQARAAKAASAAPIRVVDSSSSPLPIPSEAPSFWTHGQSSGPTSAQPSAIGGLEVTTVLGPELRRPPPDTETGFTAGAATSAGQLSMEALIDLEQQAEFFVVLGQDEAAIDLLDRHTRGSGGNSPLPYLQLLEIHQRRGDQAAYERVRQNFDERFNASAPDWTADLHLGRSLDDYPQAVARLQSLWATPMSAMPVLEDLLFRRQGVDETFDFPAYRELLFLYAIARDISANVETDFGSIDLFLPLDDPRADSVFTDLGRPTGPVDLDVGNWPEDASMSDVAVASRARGNRTG